MPHNITQRPYQCSVWYLCHLVRFCFGLRIISLWQWRTVQWIRKLLNLAPLTLAAFTALSVNFFWSRKKLPFSSGVMLIPTNGSLVQSLNLYLDASKAATRESHSASKCGGPHHRKSSLWNTTKMGILSIHLQKNFGSYGVFLYPSLSTMASTALLKFLPEDGNPYKFPSTRSRYPGGPHL